MFFSMLSSVNCPGSAALQFAIFNGIRSISFYAPEDVCKEILSGQISLEDLFVTQSISGKEWKLPLDVQIEQDFVSVAFGSELIAKLMMRRGITTVAEAEKFLHPENYVETSPSELPGVADAVDRITKAIEKNEHITVYGDYDVDGVTGTSVLVSVLRLLGANVSYYIPNRTDEGYGLNLKAVSVLASKRRTKLIISCDCGISNFAEINFAKSLGVDAIVCDHHTMPDMLPPTVATVHPKLLHEEHPLYHLPGVGVAYKLCEALLNAKGMPEEKDKLLDFVTLGMIADMVPLVSENRYLVQIGLPKLAASPRPGIKALLAQVGNYNSGATSAAAGTELVGFGIAPRINAVGRLADAEQAVELLTTEDANQAEEIARNLQLENTRRQEMCEKIFFEADQMVQNRINLETDRAIFVYDKGWHHGVVGIVASRLVEKYHLPVFIGEHHVNEGIIKGSARGVEGVDLYEVLKANEHLLVKWGGHKMAAGFSLEADKAEALMTGLSSTCNQMLEGKSLVPTLEIDLQVPAPEVTLETAHLISKLAPFGIANKKPVLVVSSLTCLGARPLGKEGKHHRLALKDTKSGALFEAVMWNSRNRIPHDGQSIDVAFTPEVNRFNGTERLQLVLADWRTIGGAVSPQPKAAHEVLPAQAPQKVETPVQKIVQAAPQASRPQPEVVPAPANPPMAARPASAQSVSTQAAKVMPAARPIISSKTNWKDLRAYGDKQAVLDKAIANLGGKLAIFGESATKIPNANFYDRTMDNLNANQKHLLLWQYPPSLQVFQSILAKSQATDIYIVGGAQEDDLDPNVFVRKLMGIVRFAVNQKDGKAEGEKIASALGVSKMAVALGLTLLRKVHLIDWFAEEGMLYLDLLGEQSGRPPGELESQNEFRQMAASLKEVKEFRIWCAKTAIKDIQLALAPNQIRLNSQNSSQTEFADEPSQHQFDTVSTISD